MPAYMSISHIHAGTVLGSSGECWILWSCSCGWLSAALWVVGIKAWLPGRVYVWRSKDNLKYQSLIFTLFETRSLVSHVCMPGDSPVSVSHLTMESWVCTGVFCIWLSIGSRDLNQILTLKRQTPSPLSHHSM